MLFWTNILNFGYFWLKKALFYNEQTDFDVASTSNSVGNFDHRKVVEPTDTMDTVSDDLEVHNCTDEVSEEKEDKASESNINQSIQFIFNQTILKTQNEKKTME